MSRKEAVAARRDRVLEYKLQGGITHVQMAQILDVSPGTIDQDVRQLRRSGQLSNLPDGELARRYIDTVWGFLHEQLEELRGLTSEDRDAAHDYIISTADAYAALADKLKWSELAESFRKAR